MQEDFPTLSSFSISLSSCLMDMLLEIKAVTHFREYYYNLSLYAV